jgi:succinyl-CoA synthetase alpha subunit
MSILIDENTRVLVQGITGREGSFHAQQMKEFGTQVVGGVRPGKGGTEVDGVPVFDTVADAVRQTGANAWVAFVPGPGSADAVMEAADAGIPLLVNIAERTPIHDAARAYRFVTERGLRLIGPNCPGLVSAGKSKVGIMPNMLFKRGDVGVVSRSGTLTYEMVNELTTRGIGQSTVVGIGGDPIIGTTFIDVLRLFDADPETEAIVLIGEIGGTDEEIAAEYIGSRSGKPVVAFISGRTAPPGKRMGHAGAIISGGKGTAQEKLAVMEECGIKTTRNPAEMGRTLKSVLR